MRRYYVFTTIFIFIVIFISVNVHANVTYIKEGNNPPKIAKKNKKQTHRKNKNKYSLTSPPLSTTFHKVKKGDTLLSLSKKYSLSLSELKKINNLRSTKIRIGQKVLLKRSRAKTYTVKRGDNIWKIAKRFNIDVDELKDINDLKTDQLKPGLRILLEQKAELEKTKTHEASLLQADVGEDIEKISESEKYSLEKKVTLIAKKLLNIPYRFGGNNIHGIDCSAFVKKVYGLIEIDLPRSARAQFSEGTYVDKEDLSVGDLVFFRTYASFPSHVGIYLGNNLFIHASSRDKKVTIDSLETPYYLKRFIGGKKIIEEKDDKEKLDEKG
ncbi:MAG: C40 family peptidase [Desulfobacterales bacterium]|nr:C40 family peptidase [Desulfobacterales bacterium]